MGLTTTFLVRAATLVARAARPSPYAAPIPPPKADTSLQLKAKWDKANERFNSVLEQWQAFELDAAAVLWERPQLADVSSPTTAAFHEQLERAKDLHATANPDHPADVVAFYSASLRLEMAWKRADAAARRAGTYHYDAPTRIVIERARKLLTTAVNAATAAEASTALAAAHRILDKINVTIPAGAYNRLQAAARHQLTERHRTTPAAEELVADTATPST